jgi:acyl-CoA thioester hydrolase
MSENAFSRPVQIRWSDLDPNFHVRHSVYYDWGAQCRIDYFSAHGLTLESMQKAHYGPILFREESQFRKEIRGDDQMTIRFEVMWSKRDMSRWSIRHQLIKADGKLAATITVDGAWMDTNLRKLTIPPPEAQEQMANAPKAAEFVWVD